MALRRRGMGTTLTSSLWTACLFGVTPWGESLMDDAESRLLLGLAVTMTVVTTIRNCLRPFDEVYEAGREIGRAEAAAERDSPNVVRLRPETRLLRAVDRLR